jgi:hypothetical protein
MSAKPRVLPPVTKDGALSVLPSSPTKEFIRCTCSHAAWRISPGVDEWECACPPMQCHGPKQVADADGTPQLRWIPYRLRAFPSVATE